MSTREVTRFESSYIYDRKPTMYGNQQEEYLALAEAAIQKATDTIQTAKQTEGTSLQDVFFTVLKDMHQARHEIALKHTPDKARHFGVLRSSKEQVPTEGYLTLATSLGHPYEEYNTILLQQLHSMVFAMKHDLRTFTETESTCKEKVLGKECSYHVKVYDSKELQSLGWGKELSEEEMQAILETDKPILDIFRDYELMKKLKKKDPELYRRVTMVGTFRNMFEEFPPARKISLGNGSFTYDGDLDNLRNLYVVGTLRLEIDGKMYALSRCLTWMYQTFKEDPVDRMLRCSKAMILHQDPFLLDDVLQAISKMFEKAVSWNPRTDSVQELKNRVALLRFTYAHCMPCARGDGAVGDWLETALYRVNGFVKTRYNADKLACFEPLVSTSLSRYLENYDKAIVVE